ncbi:cryptococcal mannosyltransferase 1-domain-containing protein [Diplogelasinospora grovesii]|uniref:Cryptococcal mannosyltransferase 1-domain-containing protein n=1 Tax=Diplogelasinospora grovesii TaxID=303347 RepID=A0AAN6RZD2_9PEZI|nr:cryptococcal mannosyltransferase 1-domain-containing protein [Diplogelasinospora grovesii]
MPVYFLGRCNGCLRAPFALVDQLRDMLWPRSHVLRRFRVPYIAFAVLAWSILDALLVRHRLDLAAREHRTVPAVREPVRIYIASLHWNNEVILRDFWNDGVVALARAFGPENVYVNIQESGSWDNSKGALRQLAASLNAIGVANEIRLDETTHADEMTIPPPEAGNGWIPTARGRLELRRIPYLARLRNRSLDPLREMARNGTVFDYVLFLNDVYFSVPDVYNLLHTNGGDYAAACSLDFSKPPKYYDTFALRDAEGHEHAMQTWPYFRSSRSRDALKRSQPVPVSSCWNGMVFMPAAAFYGEEGLAFRGIDDSLAEFHVEGSECCLIHADNPASYTLGVYLNPNVRVGYNSRAYQLVHPDGPWLGYLEIWSGLWKNRFYRWFTTVWIKEWVVRNRQSKWEHQQAGRQEKGTFCLINEMQVLLANGWAHV